MIVTAKLICDKCKEEITNFRDLYFLEMYTKRNNDCIINVLVELHYCKKCFKKVKL